MAARRAASTSWPPQAPVSTGNGSAAASSLQAALARIADPRERMLGIVGAHHFGGDTNDPIRSFVGDVPWGGALLIEASPIIARELTQSIAAHNPLPRVPADRVRLLPHTALAIRPPTGLQPSEPAP